MTDREMLELAARAAGIRTPSPDDMDPGGRQYEESLGLWCKFKWGWNWWNPLADDGDALRLAVKLDIEIYQGDDEGPAVCAGYWGKPERRDVARLYCIEPLADDPYAATRRAIVHTAAEIGRQMEETT